MEAIPNATHSDSETSPSRSVGEGTTRTDAGSASVPQPKKQKKGKRGLQREETKHWTKAENEKYILFLEDKGWMLSESIQDKRMKRPHKQMSQAIESKTARQCRSHHQKMIKNHGSTEQIIKFLRGKGGRADIPEQYLEEQVEPVEQKNEVKVGPQGEESDQPASGEPAWQRYIDFLNSYSPVYNWEDEVESLFGFK